LPDYRGRLPADFQPIARQAAAENGMVVGVIDERGQIHLTTFALGKVVGHQDAIRQGLLPANPRAAFSVFIDSNGTPIGIHWKSAYNPTADNIPPPHIRRIILGAIPNKALHFFESGLKT
jgi:hypothetical protein